MASSTPINSSETRSTRRKSANNKTTSNNIEDVTIIWFDQYMNEVENQQDVETTKTLLRKINDYVLFFSNPDLFLDFIKSISVEKVFLITTGSYGLEYLESIHPLKQIDSVFIFCVYHEKYLPLKEKYSKVIDVFTEQKDLMESLANNVELVTKQAAVFGLFDSNQRSTRYLTRESAAFLWFQLLTDVLRTIAMTDDINTGINEMLIHCQLYYRGNRVELNNIDEFKRNYKLEDAIVWYSKQSFIYKLVNKALRTEDIDALYTFRVYITHLRNQIAHENEQLRQTLNKAKTNIIRLYRGLKMTNGEILQMRDNIGGLISMNGFFSTSRDVEQAVRFATKKSQRSGVLGILLEIDVDVNLDKVIFADIAKYSAYPKEQEVLFDLASIFKIVHVEFDKGRNLWVMQFSGIEKSSYVVTEYIQSIGKETEETNSTLLFSRLMCDMGEYEKSEKYLKRLLSSIPEKHADMPKIYFNLGRVCNFHGEYKRSLEYYEQALVLQKIAAGPKEASFDIARTLHNIGEHYLTQQQITIALEYFEKALEMKRSVLTNRNHPSIATTLAAIGKIYIKRGNLGKALELYNQSYEMKKVTLTADHPSIADSLNNLGIIYQEMDDYEEALDCYKKSLRIKQKNLPPTHPSISVTLNNMGIIYRREGDYNKALICYTQALQIEQTTLSSDSLDLADTYNNLCILYNDQSQYKRALEAARYRLKILKKHFDDDHELVQQILSFIDEITEDVNKQSDVTENKDSPLQEYL